MNIIIGAENLNEISERYVVLELDTIKLPTADDPVTAYGLIDQMPLQDMLELQQWRELHQNLMRNYRLQNWNFCEQAIGHLKGHWRGELDSFYDNLLARVQQFQANPPDEAWDAVLVRN